MLVCDVEDGVRQTEYGEQLMHVFDRQILKCRGAEGSRTLDLYNANVALSQLSYCPNGINKCTTSTAELQMRHDRRKTVASAACLRRHASTRNLFTRDRPALLPHSASICRATRRHLRRAHVPPCDRRAPFGGDRRRLRWCVGNGAARAEGHARSAWTFAGAAHGGRGGAPLARCSVCVWGIDAAGTRLLGVGDARL